MDFTLDMLGRLPDPRSWDRGVGYYESNRVVELLEDGEGLFARVAGTEVYTVRLWVDEDTVDGTCTCPMGEAGVFCKHCVAAGLTWLADEGRLEDEWDEAEPPASPVRSSGPTVSLDDIREYLAAQDKAALVDLLVDQVRADSELRRTLMTRTALHRADGPDVESYRAAIDEATATEAFMGYGEAFSFASGVEAVVDSIEELLDAGHGEEAVELTEYALERVEAALDVVDDSDGWLGGALERLAALHHRACLAARPEPEALAERLLEWRLRSSWVTFDEAAEAYADVLGEQGLAAYKRLAEARWEALPALGPGESRGYGDSERWRLTRIMEGIARAEGDVEALVAVKSRELTHAHKYLAIAEIYRQARQYNKAMDWAQRGLAAFPERPDPRLREFLAKEHHRRGCHEEAVALAWSNFADGPSLEHYQSLKTHADRAGTWPTWRERALDHLRGRLPEPDERDGGGLPMWGRDASTMVKVFLWEGDLEAAWQQAQTHGCSRDLWLRLAELREDEHPEDAALVYSQAAERAIGQTNRRGYRDGVRFLQRVRTLMLRMGQEEEFAAYLEELRRTHKRKRILMGMLDRVQKRWDRD
ncbi:MAG: SWIM zinc finger family protein [Planctomycetota bacterium]